MKEHPFQNATFFLWILMLAFAPWEQSQEQTNPVPQAGGKSAKEQPKEEEPEANTNSGTEALQKVTQNLVAILISVLVQNNSNFGMNPGYRTQDVLNIQPVVPIGISKDWNLLVRWIVPMGNQSSPTFDRHRPLLVFHRFPDLGFPDGDVEKVQNALQDGCCPREQIFRRC